MLLPLGIRLLLDIFKLILGDRMLLGVAGIVKCVRGVSRYIAAATALFFSWLLLGGCIMVTWIIEAIVIKKLGKGVALRCFLSNLRGFHLV